MPRGEERPMSFPDDDAIPGFTWLVEERHISQVVNHMSGTLAHPTSHVDLPALTVYAFMHYGYGRSNRLLVFADLQGTPGPFKLHGKMVNGIVLFDPMTHTTTGDSGIGDFGPEGISSFVKQHRCREICKRLGLDKEIPLGEKSALKVIGDYDSEEEGDDSTGEDEDKD